MSQSEIDKKIIKDFKFTLKEKKVSKTIRAMMNISIGLFVLLTILQTVTLSIEVKKFDHLSDTFSLVDLVFSRYENVAKAIVEIRVGVNMISGTESIYTPITSNKDRLNRYIALMKICTDNLKKYETNLPKNSQWESLIKDQSERKELSIIDFTYDNNGNIYNYTRSITLQEVMQSYIIKASIFEEYREGMSGYELQQFLKKLELSFNFVTTNGVNSLLSRLQSSSDSLFTNVRSSYSAEQLYLQILYIAIGIIGMLSLGSLLPILSKINRSIRKILKYFAILKKVDFNHVEEKFKAYQSLIGQHFKEVKKDYAKINFAEDISRDQNKAKEKFTLNNDQLNKLKLMIQQSMRPTIYLYVQFSIISCIFGALMAYSIWNCINFFNILDFMLSIFQNISYRPPYTSVLLALLRVEIGNGHTLSYEGIPNLYEEYKSRFEMNEQSLMVEVQNMKSIFPSLYSYWSLIDSAQGCIEVYKDNQFRTPQLCNTTFNYMFKDGFTNPLYAIMSYNNDIHRNMTSQFDTQGYEIFREEIRRSVLLTNLTDTSCFYLFDILAALTEEARGTGIDYFANMSQTSYIKFSIAIIILVVVYLVYVEVTLYKLNAYIWKVKYLLGIIPLYMLLDQADDIRKIIHELS